MTDNTRERREDMCREYLPIGPTPDKIYTRKEQEEYAKRSGAKYVAAAIKQEREHAAKRADAKAKRQARQDRKDSELASAVMELLWRVNRDATNNPYHAINKVRKRLKNGLQGALLTALRANDIDRAFDICTTEIGDYDMKVKVTWDRVYESIAYSLRDFGYRNVTADIICEIHNAMKEGKTGQQLPHGIVGMFAEKQLKEHIK